MEEMIDSSVELFSELLSKYKLSDAQLQLIRDIRRRGKNKLAAQNCRKRKLEVIQTVEDEVRCAGKQLDIGSNVQIRQMLMVAACWWTHIPCWFAWFEGWQQSGTESAFVK